MNRQQFYARQLVAPSDLVLEFNNFERYIKQFYSDHHNGGIIHGGACSVGNPATTIRVDVDGVTADFVAWDSTGDRIRFNAPANPNVIVLGNISSPLATEEIFGYLYVSYVRECLPANRRVSPITGANINYYFTDTHEFIVDKGLAATIGNAALPAIRTDGSILLCSFVVRNGPIVVSVDDSIQDRDTFGDTIYNLNNVTTALGDAFHDPQGRRTNPASSAAPFGTFTQNELKALNDLSTGITGTSAHKRNLNMGDGTGGTGIAGSFTAAELDAINEFIASPVRNLPPTATEVFGTFTANELDALNDAITGPTGSSAVRNLVANNTNAFGTFTAAELDALNDSITGPTGSSVVRNLSANSTNAFGTFTAAELDAINESIASTVRLAGNPTVSPSDSNPFVVMTLAQLRALFNPIVPRPGQTRPAGAPTANNYFLTKESDAPAGEVAFFARPTTPDGWLVCDGGSYSTTDYPRLFAATGYQFGGGGANFNVPDLRGYFIRGSGTNSDGTVSGAFGVRQTDAIQSHTHTYQNDSANAVNYDFGGSSINMADSYFQDTTGSTGGTETRPRNIALLPCIRY